MNDFASDEDFMAVMLGEFLDESEGQLSRLNENLLVLDELVGALDQSEAAAADREVLNEMFRDAHSLKGLSAMLGFEDINKLTHRIENVFDAARRDDLGITRELTDLMFQAIDHLTTMVDNLKQSQGGQADVDYEPVVEQLQQLIEGRGLAGAENAARQADGCEVAAAQIEATPEALLDDLSAEWDAGPSSDPPAGPPADPLGDVQDEANIPEKYLAIFIDESDQALDELCELLERYAEVQADALIVISHRIKGAAASIGLNRAAKLAHAMEDVLQDCREAGGAISEKVADALFFATDALRNSVDTLRGGGDGADDFATAYQTLRYVQQQLPSEASADASAEAPAEAPTEVPAEEAGEVSASPVSGSASSPSEGDAALKRIAQAVPPAVIDQPPAGQTVLVGTIHLRPGLPLADVKAKMILQRLGALGELHHRRPADDATLDAEDLETLEFALVSAHPVELIRSQVDLDGVDQINTRVLAAGMPKPADVAAPPAVSSTPQPADQAASPKPTPANAARPKAAPPKAAPPKAEPPSAEPPKATPSALAGDEKPAGPAPTGPSPTGPSPAGQSPAGASKERPAETLRVDIERLDQLMNLSGQLVINKAQFSQLSEQLKGLSTRKQSVYKLSNATAMLDRMLTETNAVRGASTDSGFNQQMRNHILQVKEDLAVVERDLAELRQTRNTINDLCEAVHQLDRVTDGIQKSVMDTRMVPVGPLFSRFKRVVRDVTRLNGKDIALEIRGEKTELDKRMIDAIADPLIHMVRNSADHGVEAPPQRRSAGKPVRGKITLDAFHRGNRVFIQVRDDGKGLDPAQLRDKAIAKGIISAQEAERLSEQQCLQLIWEPGFSTAEQVTEVSGRGMGMDIVRSKIEQLSGTVELDSQVGVGTTITIKLPLTMAILPSLLTVVASDVFAIPLESVKEIVRVHNRDLSTVRGIQTATVRGRVISLVELGELFHWNTPVARATQADQEHTLVIVGADGNELGLAVDRLLGEEDIVIKSLAENYRNVEGLAGASILGDGRVSLILDVTALLSLSCRHTAAVDPETPPTGGA